MIESSHASICVNRKIARDPTPRPLAAHVKGRQGEAGGLKSLLQ